jgi:subtilisin family serine protease
VLALEPVTAVALENETGPCEARPDDPACATLARRQERAQAPTQSTPWGVARVGGPLDAADRTAWILDSGVDHRHPDLEVDLSRSVSFVGSGPDDGAGGSADVDDPLGHGTFIAGIVAARDDDRDVVGVAPGTAVVSVRGLDELGQGTTAWWPASISWRATPSRGTSPTSAWWGAAIARQSRRRSGALRIAASCS